jgi:hypothetical protein
MNAGNIVPETNKANLRLVKLSRASAWLLLAGIVVLMVSGWGITQTGVIHTATFGLVDRRTADTIHRGTNGPLVFLFLSHVLINIRLMLYRRRPAGGWLAGGILIAVGAALMAITVYLEYFRLGG